MKKNGKRLWSLLLSATILFTANTSVFGSEVTGQAGAAERTEVQTTEQTETQAEKEQPETQIVEQPETETTEETEQQNTEQKNEGETGTAGTAETETESGTTEQKEISGEVILDKNNDEVEIKATDKPYLALGADLTDAQKNTVLSLMGINTENLSDYDVVSITNAQEHQYLDSYIDPAKIGTRSLSSVVIVKREKGNGINISTKNINYCTVGMYKNALATAGITDADIIVAGPTPISGTAALVGVFKAYQEMTGENIEENVIDAALHELVITGELEETIEGLTDEEVEEFIAYIKSLIAQKDLSDEEGINEAIDEACEKYEVILSDEERQKIVDLLLKITSLGIDLDGLVDYAASLFNHYRNGEASNGLLSTIGNFFSNVFTAIGDFFKNLFR